MDTAPQGWSIASYDPTQLLAAFSCLRLRDGYRLAAYRFREGGNGNGFVFAIPEDRKLPEPPESGFGLGWSSSGSALFTCAEDSLPDWVRADVGHLLEGDDSPLSYFEASILLRELRELGAKWHGCSWSTHELVTSGRQKLWQRWKWLSKKPEDWRPEVTRDRMDRWRVTFYSYSGLVQERILRHRDTFQDGYQFHSEEAEIAIGKRGYIF